MTQKRISLCFLLFLLYKYKYTFILRASVFTGSWITSVLLSEMSFKTPSGNIKEIEVFKWVALPYYRCGGSTVWLHWTQNNWLTDMNSWMQFLFQFVPFKEEIIHDCQNCQIWILLIVMHEGHNCHFTCLEFPCFVNRSGCSRRASRRGAGIMVNWSIVSICQTVTNGIWDIEQRILMLLDFFLQLKEGEGCWPQ